jgi:FkbH-like protein
VLLAIASKNDEATALEAIRSHPEMVLRLDDFAGWRIDWRDKAQNIADLVASLNLGLDAVVFIDDNPVERARVRGALPEILVPDWPDDKRLYTHALHSLDCFDKPSISDEDRRRSQMYVSERKRSDRRAQIGSLDEWLGTLHQQVTVEPLSRANLGRLVQLLNKTNQMNLSTRRMSEQEFKAWADMEHHRVWAINVADTFGDSGLTGVLSVEVDGFGARIVDFLLSCRVMGRKIEEAMLHIAVEWARCAQIKEIRLVYSPTARNGPCLDFLQRSGLRSQSENVFVWDADLEYPLHPSIRLVQLSGDPSGDPASRPEIPLAAPSGANEPASDRRNQESSASGG